MKHPVGIEVDLYWYAIGEEDFLFSFFSTIAVRLENSQWGSRYALTMDPLYQGEIRVDDLPALRRELREIRAEMEKLPPHDQVWNCEKPTVAVPNEGGNPSAKTLADCFLTSGGTSLFEVFDEAIEDGLQYQSDLLIQPL